MISLDAIALHKNGSNYDIMFSKVSNKFNSWNIYNMLYSWSRVLIDSVGKKQA